jgi:phosphatidylglycerophosphate synthase
MYPIKAGVTFAIMMVVAGGVWRARRPRTPFGLANQITTVRAFLVALVAGAIGEPASASIAAAAVGASLLATLLDGVDGWAARRSDSSSAFGARFDMEVDALLILALAVLVWQHDKAGLWVVLSGLLRYLFVAGGWVMPWLRQPLPYRRRRQAVCVVQIGGLMLALTPVITWPISAALAAIALIALCYSFIIDTLWLWHRVS